MRTPIVLLSLTVSFASPPGVEGPTPIPRGQYVESRTASVYVGACHNGSEATTQGREALLAWHFQSGAHAGIDLSGADIAVAIAGDENLADANTARSAVIYVALKDSPAQRRALIDLVRTRSPNLLGDVRAEKTVALRFETDRESYAIEAPGYFVLRGRTMPDRACCKMPFNVWYTPFADVDAPIVGANTEFRFDDRSLGRAWSRPNENASFAGDFCFSARARVHESAATSSGADGGEPVAEKAAGR